ncbi:hypothetical protein D3C87_1063620 [compost metagenome]
MERPGFGKSGRFIMKLRFIQMKQFSKNDAAAPTVHNNMMIAPNDSMIHFRQADHVNPQQRVPAEIKFNCPVFALRTGDKLDLLRRTQA